MKYFKFMSMMLLAVSLAFTACGDGDGGDESSAVDGLSAGDSAIYLVDGVSFVMIYVPGGLNFPTGISDESTATVSNAYWIGETEVTYELWKKVYDWATDAARGSNRYYFTSAASIGSGGTGSTQQPVTTVNWRDSIVWCNALTELYNTQKGTSYECVYTYLNAVIRDSRAGNATACDGAVAGSTAMGFRLLTGNEWELAARWRNDATNTVSGYTNPYFTKGNSASGAATYYNNNTGGSGEPGKSANDSVAVYNKYWNGSWQITGVTSTAVVKSKGSGGANALGLYDISGNVWEWCFDVNGAGRMYRGGSWDENASKLQVGYWYGGPADVAGSPLGFRFARTQ